MKHIYSTRQLILLHQQKAQSLFLRMRHLTAADMVSLIIKKAKASEKLAAKSKNLKGTYKRYLREGAGIQTAAVTELAKRVNATGNSTMLEQENLRLRSKLFESEQKIAKMEKMISTYMESGDHPKRQTRVTSKMGSTPLCPSPTIDDTESYEISTRKTQRNKHAEHTDVIASQGYISKDGLAAFIETRLSTFKEEILALFKPITALIEGNIQQKETTTSGNKNKKMSLVRKESTNTPA